jgi:hypothetical protein
MMPVGASDSIGSKRAAPSSNSLLPRMFIAGLIGLLAYFLYGFIYQASTSRMADQKHVSKLLVLPEQPESADASLSQIQLFTQYGWRRYISKDSLDKLNRKRQKLLNAKTAYPLKVALVALLSRSIRDDELDLVERRIVDFFSDPKFRWLDDRTKDAAQELRNNVAIRRTSIARAKAEEEERIREQQENQGGGSGGIGDPSPNPADGFILGPRGGCYYITDSGGKEYVDRSNCY